MKKIISLFDFEVDELKSKIENIDVLRKEITELGLIANEQGSETFGHDNPILESKQEKERMLSIMLPEIRKIQELLRRCFVVKEEDFPNKDSEIKVGSVVTYSMDDQNPISILITGAVQGKKKFFKGKNLFTVCTESPIWEGLGGKKIGDETIVNIGGKNRKIKILDIE